MRMTMMRARLLVAILSLALAGGAPAAQAGDEPLPLTLAEAIRLAVENNLEVRAELYNPAQFEAEINRNQGIYDPVFSAQTGVTDVTLNSPATAGPDPNRSQVWQASSSLSQLFWTGATASLDFTNSLLSNNSAATYNNYWQSGLGVSINQPLLKKFGRENTEAAINISRLAKSASLERLHSRLLRTVAQVRRDYFTLYNLQEQWRVKQVSLELATKILTETKARVAAGVMPAMEIINAEYGVAAREKELLDAERLVQDQTDSLAVLLQLHSSAAIRTVDLPRQEPLTVDSDQAIKRALNNPSITEQKKALEVGKLQTRILANNTKPDLSLSAANTLGGLDQNYGRDLEKVASIGYPTWRVGVNFSYPLGNDVAENDYRKSLLKNQQAALQIRSLEEGITNEVKAAVRGIETGIKQMAVAERGRAYAEERLRAFARKNEVGLATTKEVLEVERDLATAKSAQITAVVSYDNAITRLWELTGELLERQRISLDAKAADDLYSATARDK